VSFSRLAQELKVRPPSLYNHVDGMPSLLDALAALALGQLLDQSRTALMGRSHWDGLAALAHAQRSYAAAHPGLYEATFRSLHRPGAEGAAIADAYLDLFLAALRGFDLHGEDAMHTIRCLRAAIGGFIEIERRGGFGMPVDIDESFSRLLEMLRMALAGGAMRRRGCT
jgi:AcrR family transcriptional regulator